MTYEFSPVPQLFSPWSTQKSCNPCYIFTWTINTPALNHLCNFHTWTVRYRRHGSKYVIIRRLIDCYSVRSLQVIKEAVLSYLTIGEAQWRMRYLSFGPFLSMMHWQRSPTSHCYVTKHSLSAHARHWCFSDRVECFTDDHRTRYLWYVSQMHASLALC